jgi:hypothetical protein
MFSKLRNVVEFNIKGLINSFKVKFKALEIYSSAFLLEEVGNQ